MQQPPLQVVKHPHLALRHESKPVKRVDAELVGIVREMFQLMYESGGIGLAANQVDLPLRLFVVNLAAAPDEGEELVFINPVLSKPKGNVEMEEGCLSFPQMYGPVVRPKEITVNAYNLRGEEIKAHLSGMLARVVLHEYDHLDGVLFIDRMTSIAKSKVEHVVEEFEVEFESRRNVGQIPDDTTITAELAQWEGRYC